MPLRLETYREIRSLGLSASRTGDGLHRVNFRGGREATAFYTESLDEALEVARKMAAGHPVPERRVPVPPNMPPEHVAAAKAALLSVSLLVQGFNGDVPAWARDEVTALAKTLQRAGLALVLSVAVLVGWSADPNGGTATAAETLGRAVASAVSSAAQVVSVTAQAVSEAVVEAVTGEPAAPAEQRPSVPPRETTLDEQLASLTQPDSTPEVDTIGELLVAAVEAVTGGDDGQVVAGPEQVVAEGQPDSSAEVEEPATNEPSDEPQ